MHKYMGLDWVRMSPLRGLGCFLISLASKFHPFGIQLKRHTLTLKCRYILTPKGGIL